MFDSTCSDGSIFLSVCVGCIAVHCPGVSHILNVYMTCVVCLQLPASFFAYRKQQHRWTCGPVQLWRKAAVDIWGSSLPLFSKLDLIFCYFGIRKFATHWVSLGFFCTIVPLSVFTPEVRSSPTRIMLCSRQLLHETALLMDFCIACDVQSVCRGIGLCIENAAHSHKCRD